MLLIARLNLLLIASENEANRTHDLLSVQRIFFVLHADVGDALLHDLVLTQNLHALLFKSGERIGEIIDEIARQD